MLSESKKRKVTECQIFLTRRCNLSCGYCKLTKKKFDNGLMMDEWKIAFSNIEKIGIKTVKILGGEPSIVEHIEDFIEFINEETRIKFAVLSNSIFGNEKTKSLMNAGMQGYFASIGGLDDIKTIDKHGVIKLSVGFSKLLELKDMGLSIVCANIVMNKNNIREIPDIIRSLSENGIWSNLCPVVHGSGSWEFRTENNSEYIFTKNNSKLIDSVMEELVMMKKDGARVAVSDSCLENMSKYCIDLDWKCEELSQLRIDCDGALTICNDIRGELASKYNIMNMNSEKFEEFKTDWKESK